MGIYSKPPTRVYVVEKQPLMARALCSALARDPALKVAGYAPVVQPRRIAGATPDLILIDLDHLRDDLAAQISVCRRTAPTSRICVLSSSPDIDVMMQVLSAGANGYIIKDITPQRLIACLHAVTASGFYADPRMSTLLLRRNFSKSEVPLSPRETQVVKLIAQGLSNKQISDRLTLSDKTVKNHVANIFSKLHFTARTQVAIYAIRSGLG